jgi:hypothetical protein
MSSLYNPPHLAMVGPAHKSRDSFFTSLVFAPLVHKTDQLRREKQRTKKQRGER